MSIQTNSPDSNLAASLSAADITAGGGALQSALDTETALARNADNLTGGTVANARLPGASNAAAQAAQDTATALVQTNLTTEVARATAAEGANTTAIALKAPLASPTFTGTVTSPGVTLTAPLVMSANTTITSTDYAVGRVSGRIRSNAPTGQAFAWDLGGVEIMYLGSGKLYAPAIITNESISGFQVRNEQSSAYSTMVSGGTAEATGGTIYLYGSTNALAGGIHSYPTPVALSNSATRTITGSATSYSGFVKLIDNTNKKAALYRVSAGVPTLVNGDTQFVAGTPGGSQIGLELSGSNLRINNGSGASANMAYVLELG